MDENSDNDLQPALPSEEMEGIIHVSQSVSYEGPIPPAAELKC